MLPTNTGFAPKASLSKRWPAISVIFFTARLLAGVLLAAGTSAKGAEPAQAGAARPATPRTLVFFGDSLTAGYGLENPGAEAFPALIQKKITAAHLPWRVVNAGLSGETSSGGLRRVDWVLRQPADAFVLALGANDGLRGIEPAVTRDNLARIIKRVRAQNPAVVIVLAGMQMPPQFGSDYTHDFARIFPELAQEQRTALVPFLLEGVAGRAELNQPDGIHPTGAGHRRIAENVWATLLPLL